MEDFYAFKDEEHDPYGDLLGLHHPRDKTIQLIISLIFGLSAFLGFCILRPRWTGLYAARKRQKNEATVLPELPDSLFGWMLPLWRITDQQILASAGLDAYAFLAFFKMAMKFLLVTLFFSLIVIKPVHDANPDPSDRDNKTHHGNHSKEHDLLMRRSPTTLSLNDTLSEIFAQDPDYLWMYVIFSYLFSALAIYLLVTETGKFIEVRQEYLGTQTSVTDRTIRLSGIPVELQEEGKIKEFIESLGIGKVESVTLCRQWKELDDAVDGRMSTLRKLEEAYTTHMRRRRVERNRATLPISQPIPPSPRARSITQDDVEDESAGLLNTNGEPHIVPYERERPKTRLRYGFMNLRSKQVDAIDYYEKRLRKADEHIKELRQKTFAPTPLAFVTLDSVAASQMAIQAVLDPSPQQLIANPSPAPVDVVWRNTYLSRRSRMLRSWSITLLIAFLTIFWSVILVPVAGLLTLETIGKVFPRLADVLEEHENIQSLVNTQTPTLIASLLMVLVSYVYYWLSWCQGMISQGDVELSAISKNFFFTFFNFFVVFTLLNTGAEFYKLFKHFNDAIRDVQRTAYVMALSLQNSLNFYVNFIILQGIGLFPFRLLEVGSVSLYPVYRMGAKTPRDYAELVQPPVFSYAFYLPNALMIFIICMVYSVLRSSWQVLLPGFIYFALGHFVYKYQLLYAMDHQQQATGRAWGMMCDRVFMGLVLFQITTSGQLGFKGAVSRSLLILPVIVATIWTGIAFSRKYKPLLQFIALRSVRMGEHYTDDPTTPDANSTSSTDLAPERNVWAENSNGSQLRYFRETRIGLQQQGVDDNGELDLRFINPSLVAPLNPLWIGDKNFRRESEAVVPDGDETV